MEEAKFLRGLYDAYAKSGFVTDTGHDTDEASSSHSGTAASNFVPDNDRDEIPFMAPWQ